jgi:hypothetical protein
MSFEPFDDSSGSYSARPVKQIWELDIFGEGSDKNVGEWLQGEKNWLYEENRPRFEKIKRNLAIYKGYQYRSQNISARDPDIVDRPRLVEKVVINNIMDMVSETTAQEIQYKPAVEFLPANDEFVDKTGTRLVKQLNDYIWYKNKFDGNLFPKWVKMKRIEGEAYLMVEWDEDFGDEFPESKEIRKQAKNQPATITTADGKNVTIDQPHFMGDVKFTLKSTLDILLEKKDSFDQVNYMFVREVMPQAEAKRKYKGYADAINPPAGIMFYDYERMEMRPMAGYVEIVKFYHKRTSMLPQGAEIHFCGATVVQPAKPFPFSHRNLPTVRLTDLDFPGQLAGESFIDQVKDIFGIYNNLTNIAHRNLIMVGHPKWAVPKGSVNLESLGNDITIMQYTGAQAPHLVSANPTPPELYSFRESLKLDGFRISGSGQVSRGEPPPGIKAAVALQFLAEQEQKRDNEIILKTNEAVRQLGEMTICVASDKYQDDEKRVIKIIGANNSWMTDFFPVKYLQQEYDVRVQNASALPSSKSGRLQYLISLNESFPGVMAQEQILELLDLAQSQEYMDQVIASVRAAKAENDQMLEDNMTINDPAEYEDHFQHWTVHVAKIREWAFKNKTPIERQNKLKDHIAAHEMLMVEKAAINPAFASKLAEIKDFPLFFVQPPVQPMPQIPNVGPQPSEPLALQDAPMDVAPDMPTQAELMAAEAQPIDRQPNEMLPS